MFTLTLLLIAISSVLVISLSPIPLPITSVAPNRQEEQSDLNVSIMPRLKLL